MSDAVTQSKSPPGPKSARRREYLTNRAEFLHNLAREYGDIVRFRFGFWDTYLLNHPDYVQKVLVGHNCPRNLSAKLVKWILGESLLTIHGQHHLAHRKILQRAFQRENLEGLSDAITQYTLEVGEHWDNRAASNAPIDIVQEMKGLTLRIIRRFLFGDDDSRAEEIRETLNEIVDTMDRVLTPAGLVGSFLPTPGTLRFRRARRRWNRIVQRLMAERAELANHNGSVLSIAAASANGPSNGTLSPKQVAEELLALVFAGHETTAIMLSWAWRLLAEHPDVERKLHDELQSALGGRVPTYDDMERLPYTKNFLMEAMRVYPPAYIMERATTQPLQCGEYVIPAGKTLLLSPYAMHRHPDYYPDPERFDPDRWDANGVGQVPNYAYYPFAGGPHKCIGERLAWMEGILVLGTLAQRWRVRLSANEPVHAYPAVTLRPKGKLLMRPERR